MKRVKTLIHLHTNYSFDCNISPEYLLDFAISNGIGCLAITDHDTIDGARRVAELARNTDVEVIIGEEVSTRDGHLIGLFLKENIDPGMSARETALEIRRQGGLVLAPHPFVKFLGCGLGDAMWDIVDLIDAVEVNNAQNLSRTADRRAEMFARSMGLPTYVGADSHMASSIAPCYQTMSRFTSPDEFVDSLKQADLVRGRHPLDYFIYSAYRTLRYELTRTIPRQYGVNYSPHPSGFPAPLGRENSVSRNDCASAAA